MVPVDKPVTHSLHTLVARGQNMNETTEKGLDWCKRCYSNITVSPKILQNDTANTSFEEHYNTH